MTLWRARKLAHAFRDDNVSEREQFHYALLYTLLTYVVSDFYLMQSLQVGTLNQLDALVSALSLLIGGAGTWLCFKASQKKSSNIGFVSRFICLGVPVLVRVFIIVLAAGALVVVVLSFSIHVPVIESYFETENTTPFDVVLICGTEAFYFFYLSRMIGESYT